MSSGGPGYGSGYARSPSKYSRGDNFNDYGGTTAPTKRREAPRRPSGRRGSSKATPGEWEQVMDEDGNIVRFNPKLGLLSAPDVRPIFFLRVFYSRYFGINDCENIFCFH